MEKIKTIIAKEWAEVFRNRLVLFTVGFLPLLLIILPVAMLMGVAGLDTGGPEMAEIRELTQFCPPEMSDLECGQIYMLDLFTLLFMILPVAIPVTIASYSIVGEKSMRSLEPLLATPITTAELLTGKAVAAVVPAVVATWTSFAIYAAAVYLLTTAPVFAHLLSPLWLIAIFVVGPLLTLMAVHVALIISSRVTDPRAAEQLSMVVVLPIILFLVGQSAGLVLLNRELILIIAAILIVIDLGLTYLGVKLFQRETILTRWK